MAEGEVPGAEPPVRAEVVHSSARTRVTRLFLPGGPVVCKDPLGPDADRRVRHERAVLERLRGVEGVAQLAQGPGGAGSIVLADAGGATLAGAAKPLPPGELAGLGLGLARAVAGMHRAGVLHRDISPANIVISGDGRPCLVDFALAVWLAEIRPGFTHHAEIAGTLAYLAPEATGRTARPVDQRADLYALGAVLYELATGGPPFGSGDPLQLSHDLLARVPVPPAEVNPAVPGFLSEIIMHLLEKEPDHRYQTADGLVFDLERLRDAGASAAGLRVGERDVPLRLLPPSRLVGREGEVAALRAALEDAVAGRCRGVLVGGAPGVGKTVLADELRPVVTGADGWFVAGKFDAYRRDLEFDAVNQALRALGRLLLAEPDQELAKVREQIVEAAGPNAGLLTATVPEFAALLGVPPDPGDPLTAQVRAQQAALAVLRAVASPGRPLVVFVDDLQWAGRTPLGLVDLVLGGEPAEGLLLVGAYRDGDVEPAHPLAAPLSRWREQAGVRQLRLANLPAASLAIMVAEMLHVHRAAAAGLAEVIGPHTSGNPFQTVELLNALRRDGVLAATARGWRWDPAAVRARLGRSELGGLPAALAAAMPPASRQLVEAMACLGGRAELGLLQAAAGEPAAVMDHALAPALDEGLLVAEPGAHPAVRFRHDRIREVILGGLNPGRRRTLQLAMARRLAAAPDLFAVAAEQYLPVIDAVDDPAERRAVVELLRRAAGQATLTGDHAKVNTLLAAALRLVDPGQTATLVQVHTGGHAALFSLGRLEEADEEYATIERLPATALDRADVTWVQVHSLTQRNRLLEAFGIGLGSLRELGITVPAADRLPAELDHQFGYLYRWLDHAEDAEALTRPDITDPTLLAAAGLLNAVLPAAYFDADHVMFGWLSLEALRIWLEHGPARTLVGPASHAARAAVALRGDYAAGYRAARQVLALSEASGYEPGTSQARRQFGVLAWCFEPIENCAEALRRAREGLIAGGDLSFAGYTYLAEAEYLLDCGPSLDVYVAVLEEGQAFVWRTGHELTGERLDPHRWLVGVLRGERAPTGQVIPDDSGHVANPVVASSMHLSRARAAAIFGDLAGLARHTAAIMPLPSVLEPTSVAAAARLLRGLALAEQARNADAAERGGLLAELDEVTRWLAARAADAPDNFAHLLRLLEAERAWAIGDFRAALLGFDAARREAARRQRPWHRALITERAARFYLAHGADQAGYDLLAQARQAYREWGATAKVAQLDWAYPTLQPQAGPAAAQHGDLHPPPAAAATGTIDLLGIVSASQALSSETSLARLHARVVQVLSAITGATGVHLLVCSQDGQDWLLPAPGGDGETVAVSGAGHERVVPMSVLRYVQRTGEPLAVADAATDDRFARNPYFAGLACCALLAVPVLDRGTLRAVLVLENRLIRGAFTAERLEAVQLIAGQLAVSLHNAQLYTELTASRARIVAAGDQARRRIERNLHDGAQQQLITVAVMLSGLRDRVPAGLHAELDQARDQLGAARREIRELSQGLHPAILTEAGLGPALRALARRAPLPVHLSLDAGAARRLPEPAEISAYYLVAEALTNAAKHAHASAVHVEIQASSDLLRITVRDDGAGGADFARGTGLTGLKDRVEAVGGRLFLHSPHGTGTSLHAEIPLTTHGLPA